MWTRARLARVGLVAEKKRPPLIITEEHDWGQYRMFVIESIRDGAKKQDDLDKRLQGLALKVAGIAALVTTIISIGTQLLLKAFGG
jgi:hypothetical protein